MSQIYVPISSGVLPPSIPTSFVTQNGTAVPALNILLVDGFDSTENNDNGIITKGGVVGTGTANELDIVLTNRLQGTATVSGAVTGNIITFSLGASASVYRFSFLVTGRDTGSGDGVGYSIDASARTDGVTSTVISTPDIDADEDASISAALINMVASGNTVIVQATGVVGRTINYNAVGTYVVV